MGPGFHVHMWRYSVWWVPQTAAIMWPCRAVFSTVHNCYRRPSCQGEGCASTNPKAWSDGGEPTNVFVDTPYGAHTCICHACLKWADDTQLKIRVGSAKSIETSWPDRPAHKEYSVYARPCRRWTICYACTWLWCQEHHTCESAVIDTHCMYTFMVRCLDWSDWLTNYLINTQSREKDSMHMHILANKYQ